MDKQTGRIYRDREAGLEAGVPENRLVEMQVSPTVRQRARGHVGRNEPCPCGSGKKFKNCCRSNEA